MASLKSLLGSKNFQGTEGNLEKGRIWSYNNGAMYGCMCNGACWKAPGTGKATIDVWGAGGSSSKMCCCGGGLPGNAGAFSRKEINVASGNYFCGCMGKSCNNADSLCNRGCSSNTAICWFSTTTNGCVCVQGGRSGTTFCSSSPSLYCCFRANGFCVCNRGPNCGIVCNACPGGWVACGYGGDINMCGCYGCSSFFGCYPACPCSTYYHVPLPAYVISKCGAMVSYSTESDSPNSNWSGMGIHQYINALNALSRNPSQGQPDHACWMGNRSCGCYQMQGCSSFVPYGGGAPAAVPCPGVRDSGYRGGSGAIRVKYVDG